MSNVSPVRSADTFGFTPSELRTLRALKTPAGIQKFLDDLPYNLSYTARSPKKVLHDRVASCLEGGIFAAAALRVVGFPPLIFDLEAEQDTDHVVAIFKVRGHWGAVAKSNFTGCRYREPVYRTLRELAMSYFNIYFNLRGERTLRRYSRPVNLARFDHLNWMTTEKPIWFIAEHLCEIPHISLLTPAMEKNLTRARSPHDAGRNGRPPKEIILAARKMANRTKRVTLVSFEATAKREAKGFLHAESAR